MEFPIRLPNGQWARSNEEKGKAFADHFTKVIVPHNSVDQHLEILPTVEGLPITFSLKDINDIINNLKYNRAPCLDKIPGRMVKQLPEI